MGIIRISVGVDGEEDEVGGGDTCCSEFDGYIATARPMKTGIAC